MLILAGGGEEVSPGRTSSNSGCRGAWQGSGSESSSAFLSWELQKPHGLSPEVLR